MIRVTTYTEARANFAELWDRAVEDREPVVIQRRGSEDVVLIAASEFEGIMETAHLLRSPANRERLLSALEKAKRGEGRRVSVESLGKEVGLGTEGKKERTGSRRARQAEAGEGELRPG